MNNTMIGELRAYRSFMGAHFRAQLQYRGAAWAGIGTQLFFGLIRVMVFAGFYASTTKEQPMNWEQVISYTWLAQAMLMILPFRVDAELANLIRSGNVAYELTRPVDLYKLWFSRGIALRGTPILLRVVPMVVITMGVFPLVGASEWALLPPAGWAAGGLFMLSLAAGFFLAVSIAVLMSISVLWTISARGIDRIMPTVVWVFSGIIIPLPFFPDWIQPLFNVLPFRGMMDIPFRIYTADLAGGEAFTALAVQILWTAGLVIAGSLLLKRGLKKVVVQGG